LALRRISFSHFSPPYVAAAEEDMSTRCDRVDDAPDEEETPSAETRVMERERRDG
jgi:hypothetical protein